MENVIDTLNGLTNDEEKSEFIKKFHDYWLSGIQGPNNSEDDKHENTTDMLYITYEPKFKKFRPPFSVTFWKWEISFMWAYKIHKAYQLTNCYPVAMKTEGVGDSGDKTFTLDFSCNKLDNPKVNEAVDNLLKHYEAGGSPINNMIDEWIKGIKDTPEKKSIMTWIKRLIFKLKRRWRSRNDED